MFSYYICSRYICYHNNYYGFVICMFTTSLCQECTPYFFNLQYKKCILRMHILFVRYAMLINVKKHSAAKDQNKCENMI